MKDLLRTSDLSQADFLEILSLTKRFHDDPRHKKTLLSGESVAMYFAKPSTRTRVSTEAAVAYLGGHPVVLDRHDLQLSRGETIEDTARVLSSYTSAIVVRTVEDSEVDRFARASTVPVVNALTDGHHPMQSLADLFTLGRIFGKLDDRRITYVGDGNNVAVSLAQAAALAGMEVVLACPPGYEPDAAGLEMAEKIASTTGGRVVCADDPRAAVVGASAVYTDTWLSMGDPLIQAMDRHQVLAPYQVNADLMRLAAPDAVFMHCLPAHREAEVTAQVLDGERSVVFEQAAARRPVAQAVLHALLTRRLHGSQEW